MTVSTSYSLVVLIASAVYVGFTDIGIATPEEICTTLVTSKFGQGRWDADKFKIPIFDLGCLIVNNFCFPWK